MSRLGSWVWCGSILLVLAGTPAPARADKWSIGVRIGSPGFYRPWHYHEPYPYYYRPYPVYVVPRPVYVEPQPVYVPVSPVVAQPQFVQPVAPAPRPAVAQTATIERPQLDVDRHLRQLADPNENVRQESVTQLGRMKVQRAIDPLAATLSGDASPVVREAAARALGIIGSPKALPALQYAAQADADRDVRHSARFAAEVIQSNR